MKSRILDFDKTDLGNITINLFLYFTFRHLPSFVTIKNRLKNCNCILISIIIIVSKTQNRISMTNGTMVCTIIAVSFITNYFYYMLTPKSTYMLQHINSPEQTRAWLSMYKAMQYYWHSGLALGIIATAFFAFAFRC